IVGTIRDEEVRRHYQQAMRERVQAYFAGSAAPQRDRGAARRPQGRLSVSDSLARSALARRAGGLLPLRECTILVALVNHPRLIEEFYEQVESLELSHAELRRLLGAIL